MIPIYFVSGHLDLTQSEFSEHYQPLLDNALSKNAFFVVGDARGADALAQAFLTGKTNQVTVFHMFQTPRHNVGNFAVAGGFKSDDARDKAMTEASMFDIAWVRPGREASGTARNLLRRTSTLQPRDHQIPSP
jgi:hypothetical protein